MASARDALGSLTASRSYEPEPEPAPALGLRPPLGGVGAVLALPLPPRLVVAQKSGVPLPMVVSQQAFSHTRAVPPVDAS